jgi:hypothetical protein
VLKGLARVPKRFACQDFPHQGALRPGLRLTHHIIREALGQLLVTLLIDTTGVTGDRLPEVVPSLEEGLLPFEGSQTSFKIHTIVPHVWMVHMLYAVPLDNAVSLDLRSLAAPP